MFKTFYKKNERILLFQLKNKLLEKNINSANKISYCISLIDIFNINKKIKSSIILKLLLLLELLFGNKSFINIYIIKYAKLRLQLYLKILNKNFFFLFFIIKLFYIPLLIRRNIFLLKNSYDISGNYWFTIKYINIFPFMFNLYIFLKKNIKIGIFLNSKKKNNNKLLLESLNFIKKI